MKKWYSEAINHLQRENVILCPTDTVWGLSCNALSPKAIQQIHQIKQRPETKSYILLVADEEMLHTYVEEIPEKLSQILEQSNRPTTIIYRHPKHLPQEVLAENGSVGIRIAGNEWLREFLNEFGKPMVSTSANISGEPTPLYFTEISEQIKEQVDFIVPDFQNKKENNQSSRIIKIESDGSMTTIRP